MLDIPASNTTGEGVVDGAQPTESPPQPPDSSVHVVIILLVAILTLAIITCIISHYKMGARYWSERQRRQQAPTQVSGGATPAAPTATTQLDHNPSAATLHLSPVLQERFTREAGELRDRQIRMQSVYTDTELDLPPSIPLPGGEEYSYGSLQHLHLRDPDQESEIYSGCIRPPPNRTVFNSRSPPPPYRSSSVGVLSTSSVSSSTSHQPSNTDLSSRHMEGHPLVVRCHSTNNNNIAQHTNHNHSSNNLQIL